MSTRPFHLTPLEIERAQRIRELPATQQEMLDRMLENLEEMNAEAVMEPARCANVIHLR